MKYLVFLLLLSGCASQEYYAHLWCQPTTEKAMSVGIYTRVDGKLIVKTYDATCKSIKFNGVEIEMDK